MQKKFGGHRLRLCPVGQDINREGKIEDFGLQYTTWQETDQKVFFVHFPIAWSTILSLRTSFHASLTMLKEALCSLQSPNRRCFQAYPKLSKVRN